MWKCDNCGWVGIEPMIVPGLCNGEVVDIIDLFCPMCSRGEGKGGVHFLGNREERDEWFDDWFDRHSK